MPTDVLDSVHISELDDESIALLKPFLVEMAELVRTQKVYLHKSQQKLKQHGMSQSWTEKKIYVNIH